MTEGANRTPAATLAPGLMVIHGNRPESLSELVLTWTRQHPLSPLEAECVLVQSNGIAQWLKMAWAQPPAQGGLGVCAAVEVSLPSLFLWRAYRAELGRAQVPEQSPLDKRALTWRLMRLLPQFVADGQSPNLSRFLGDDPQGRKRFQLAERLADLYDQYQVYRADWLAQWAVGRWYLVNAKGEELPLPDDQVWQARLWQAVLADVGEAAMDSSRAGVHRRFMAHRASGRSPVHGEDIPRRVIVFGISSLPAQALEALSALANTVQVLLCVHNPSMHLWSDTRPERELWRSAYRRNPNLPAPELALRVGEAGGHPLLSAWGKQGRDYVGLIDRHDEPERYRDQFTPINGGRIDLFVPPDGQHLLAQLQEDMLELRPLAESRARWPAVNPATDHSLRFHRAHSAQREVEVLHDQLLARLGADASLTPRDIVVMVPNVEDYAPHIAAVFGRIAPDQPRYIPYTVLDQSERTRHPMLLALERFMALPEDRIRASDVLDWLDVPAVQQRFGLTPDDVAQLKRWIEGAGVRWGLDAQHRASLGFADVGELNSWHFGLRRMLLGYATGDAGAWEGVLPYDEVAGLSAVVLGPLKTFIDALALTAREWAQPAAPELWVTRLQALLARFFAPANDAERALMVQLGQLGDDWLAQTELAAFNAPLPATVVREAWMGQLDGPQLGRRFLSGGVSFCSLMPMRAIPFRVVCLLGMNDGDYPRQTVPAAFDLMQRDYRPGDRSRREDDRYLFLEAVLSARDALYVSWVGRNIRDNTEAAPSTLVGQLRDHVAAGWRLHESEAVLGSHRSNEGGGAAILLNAITVDHPLQPFSPAYFQAPPAGVATPQDQANAQAQALDDGDDFAGDDFSDDFADDISSHTGNDFGHDTGRDFGNDFGSTPFANPNPPVLAAAGHASQVGGPASPAPEFAPVPAPQRRREPFNAAALPPVFSFASEWAPAPQVPPDWVAPGAVQAPLPAPSAHAASASDVQRLDLGQLGRFLANPIAAFFAQRLKVQQADAADAVRDDEAFSLDGLTQWQLQAALIDPLQHAIDAMGQADAVDLGSADPSELLQALLNDQRLAGQLPLHGFGEVAQTQLRQTLGRLMANYTRVAQVWPHALAQASVLAWHSADTRVQVHASLQGLRRGPDGSLAHVQLIPGRLHKGKAIKHHLLVRPWVQHLAWHLALGSAHAESSANAAQAANAGVSTLVVSESGVWRLAPMALPDAQAAWAQLLQAWETGLCAPLPVACATAFAWVEACDERMQNGGGEPRARLPAPDAGSRQAQQAARAVFEGGFNFVGDVDKSPAIRRAYPTFDSLLREPDAFAHWAKTLYQPILRLGRAWAPPGQTLAGGADTAVRVAGGKRRDASNDAGEQGEQGEEGDWGHDDFASPDDLREGDFRP